MLSVPNSCAKCSKQGNLQRCSKCRSTWYCSRECQFAHWKSHKKTCHLPEGSDGPKPKDSENAQPQHQDGRDSTSTTSDTIPRSLNITSPKITESNDILGVKLHSEGYSSNVSSHGSRARFVDEKLSPNHPIFDRGELCPFTALYGIPIIIFSEALHYGLSGKSNQPAVYLRIEVDDGFAPFHWQASDPGTCYVVRKDRKPLSKEDIETMYEFHSSILGTDYFMDKMSGKAPYQITPKVFQNFSDKYWRKGGRLGV